MRIITDVPGPWFSWQAAYIGGRAKLGRVTYKGEEFEILDDNREGGLHAAG